MSNVARRVIAKCGGFALVAQDAGVSIVTVHRWTYDESVGGTGGHIPAKRQRPILLGARARGKDVRPDDFFDLEEFRELPDGLPMLATVQGSENRNTSLGDGDRASPANDNQRPAANDNDVDGRAHRGRPANPAPGAPESLIAANDDHGATLSRPEVR